MALANSMFNCRDRDEDLNDHIDSDTPRSGVATPQPDPSDKRLPGIMHNYFGQVGSGSSSSSQKSDPIESSAMGSELAHESRSSSFHHREEMIEDYVLLSVASDGPNKTAHPPQSQNEDEEVLPLSPNERAGTSRASTSKISRLSGLHPYPTPPASQTPSLHRLEVGDASSEGDASSVQNDVPSTSAHRKSISESIPSSVARRASLMNPLSSIVTTSNVHATHFSNPSDRYPATTPSTPIHSRLSSEFHESPSYDRLKKLTDDSARKASIPATLTRALSNQTVKSDASGGSDHSHEKNGKTNDSESYSTNGNGAPAPFPKGKLTVKIAEARGLKRSRDPYVVAVFQRNELVSKGPRPEYSDELEDSMAPQMGGIPIMRSGSDSGRPMAIPMKSRQSSNTSLSDYRDFKVKGRRSFTNPKWDTEAVL